MHGNDGDYAGGVGSEGEGRAMMISSQEGVGVTDSEVIKFVHEVGHALGLMHTDETRCGVERINGSNAHRAGDYLTDTPADPGPDICPGYDYIEFDHNTEIIDEEISCGQKCDKDGCTPYKADLFNPMRSTVDPGGVIELAHFNAEFRIPEDSVFKDYFPKLWELFPFTHDQDAVMSCTTNELMGN